MISLGIDLGGTWLRACLAADGRVLRRARVPAVSWRRLPQVLPILQARLRFRKLDLLTLGSTGLWRDKEQRQARGLLKGVSVRVRVMSDLELAHAAAFAGGPGVLVLAGTGSVALARDSEGRTARAGGLGPLLGDDGSAFWIGRRALRDPLLTRALGLKPLDLAHAEAPVRAVARQALGVLRLARFNPLARAVRGEAALRLAGLAQEAVLGLRFRGPVPLSWHGGLFCDDAFRDAFLRALAKRRFQPRPPLLAADVAAATSIFSKIAG